MTDTKPLLVLHASCFSVIAACFALSATLFKGQPEVAQILTGGALWLYGKLGFRPAKSVFDRLVASLEPSEVVQILSCRPPLAARTSGVQPIGAAATVAPAVEPQAPQPIGPKP
jgi:hypothetical protein